MAPNMETLKAVMRAACEAERPERPTVERIPDVVVKMESKGSATVGDVKAFLADVPDDALFQMSDPWGEAADATLEYKVTWLDEKSVHVSGDWDPTSYDCS